MKAALDFDQLKRNLRKPVDALPGIRLAVVADSASQLAVQALRGYGVELGLRLEVFEADYDQVDLQLLDPTSELYAFEPAFILLWQSSPKLALRFQASPAERRAAFAGEHVEHVRRLARAARDSRATILFPTFVEHDDGVFGSLGATLPSSWLYQIRSLNLRLGDLAREEPNLLLVDWAAVALEHGARSVRDDRLAVTASMAIGVDGLPHFAKKVVDLIAAATGRMKKCLILDLDNTLWGGVVGDDGLEGIQVGDLGIGKAFSGVQRWAKQLKERGIILAVSSKNEPHLAREPFDKHPDMVLRLDDIAVFQANWDNKVDNIRHIQSILEIGFDSMVFLDDNPAERMQVREALPEVCVPELPDDPADWLTFLRGLNLFETVSVTAQDGSRTALYRQEAERREVERTYANEAEFLESLEMRARVEGFTPFNIPRVAQLVLRSNQFNLRTVRYSADEVRELASASQALPLAVSLEDRFGDYGLISVIVAKRVGDAMFLDTWLMSCRVLKRGVEDFVLNELVERARAEQVTWLVGEYLPTPKNALVKDHYRRLGFEPFDGRWRLDVGAYEPHATRIRKATP